MLIPQAPSRTPRVVAILVLLLSATVGLFFFGRPKSQPQTAATPPKISSGVSNNETGREAGAREEVPAPSAVVARLSQDALAQTVSLEVGRVARPSATALAIFDDGKRRLACVLIDYSGHVYQLDHDLLPEYFPALKANNFQPAADPLAMTVSRYRSVAKQAMHYRPTGEDRLIVLLCPKEEWSALNLTCTNFAPGPLPGDYDGTKQPAF